MQTWVNTIFLLSLEVGFSWSVSAIAQVPMNLKSCSFVNITAEINHTVENIENIENTENTAQHFVQHGVAWVVDFSGPILVAPAHLVWGAERLKAKCQGLEVELKVRNISPNLDLAVLNFVDQAPTEWRAIRLNAKSEASVRAVPTDLKSGTSYRVSAALIPYQNSSINGVISLEEGALSLWPYKRSYVFGNAVRPGMSGSPVALYQSDTMDPAEQLLGMVTRTANNGRLARVIAVSEIIRVLPELAAATNSDSNKQEPISLAYSWHLNLQNELRRIRTLTLSRSGAKALVLKERCEASSFRPVSHWQPVGGSDWADGGGDRQQENSLLRPADDNAGYDKELGVFWKQYTYYKNSRSCEADGVEFPDGRVLVALRGMPVKSLDDILKQLSAYQGIFASRNRIRFLEKEGVFRISDQPLKYVSLCKSIGTARYLAWPHSERLSQLPRSVEIRVPLLLPKNVSNSGQLTPALVCEDQDRTLRFRVSMDLNERRLTAVQADLSVSSHRLAGNVQVGNCKVFVDQKKDSTWSASSENSDFTVDLRFSPQRDLVTINIMNPAARCNVSGDSSIPLFIQFIGEIYN